jgi:hypothetical protein
MAIMLFNLGSGLNAQVSMKDSLRVHMFTPAYSIQLPFGDMKSRYGLSHTVGLSYSFLLKKRWMITTEGSFLFGQNVKNKVSIFSGIASDITTSNGYIISQSGVYSNLAITERGYVLSLKTGKLLPVLKNNPNCGLLLQIGAGIMQHKIRIDVSQNDAPQLRNDYKKGYDKMCNGPALVEYFGYQHLDNNKRVNFTGGIELIQAWTQSRRAYYFAEGKKPDENRMDVLIGLKLGWIIPIYRKTGNEYYYY